MLRLLRLSTWEQQVSLPCSAWYTLHVVGMAGQNPEASPPVVVGTAGESTVLLSIISAVHGFGDWLARILRLLRLSSWEQQVSRPVLFLHRLSVAAGMPGQNPQVSLPVVVGTAGESTLFLSTSPGHGYGKGLPESSVFSACRHGNSW